MRENADGGSTNVPYQDWDFSLLNNRDKALVQLNHDQEKNNLQQPYTILQIRGFDSSLFYMISKGLSLSTG